MSAVMAEEIIKQDTIKQRLDDINAISIAIDTYDDIFSDFDPREIDHRELSEDFIIELVRRHRTDPRGKYDVVLVAPKAIRDDSTEKKIISRLTHYFHAKHIQDVKIINQIRMRGLIYILIGMIFLIGMVFTTYYQLLGKLIVELAGIVFMPLGWFGVWEGFSLIVDKPFKYEREAELFQRLSKAVFKFEYI
jgi:hypothetical protein